MYSRRNAGPDHPVAPPGGSSPQFSGGLQRQRQGTAADQAALILQNQVGMRPLLVFQ